MFVDAVPASRVRRIFDPRMGSERSLRPALGHGRSSLLMNIHGWMRRCLNPVGLQRDIAGSQKNSKGRGAERLVVAVAMVGASLYEHAAVNTIDRILLLGVGSMTGLSRRPAGDLA
jgi:hypothetical protein